MPDPTTTPTPAKATVLAKIETFFDEIGKDIETDFEAVEADLKTFFAKREKATPAQITTFEVASSLAAQARAKAATPPATPSAPPAAQTPTPAATTPPAAS